MIDSHLHNFFVKARTLLLLNNSDTVDINVPLNQFKVYKTWPSDVLRSSTICKYGAIDNWPDAAQESLAKGIIELVLKTRYKIENGCITLTVRNY